MASDLSIVVVNWNTRDLLRGCLASLPAATAGLASQTLVVDNASRDGSAAMVRAEFPAARLIESGGNLGFSRGNNLGLRSADPEAAAVLLLNPDTVCPPGSLASLRAFLAATPDAAAAGPLLIGADGRPAVSCGDFPAVRFHLLSCLDPQRRWLPARLRRAGLGRIPAADAPAGPVDYVTGACLMLKREALAQVGPLDERFFMYFEETDWCRRARAAGWRVYLRPEVRVVHLEGRAAEQASDFSLAQFQRSYRLFVAKHYGPGRLWQFRAALLAEYGLKSALRAVAPGDRARNRALARSWRRVARLQLRPEIEATPPA